MDDVVLWKTRIDEDKAKRLAKSYFLYYLIFALVVFFSMIIIVPLLLRHIC
jgi:hypothetical protein